MIPILLPVLKGTLPGFPPAPQPGLIESLTVIVLIPALVALVITLLIMGPRWLQQHNAPATKAVEGAVDQNRTVQGSVLTSET